MTAVTRNEIVGLRSGRLLIVDMEGDGSRGLTSLRVLVRCDCGAMVTRGARRIVRGETKSCGCLQRESVSARMTVDLIGRRFGNLEVIEYKGSDQRQNALWLCRFDCAHTTVLRGASLLSGEGKTCAACFVPAYETVHGRVRRSRGSASLHACVDCGESANDWSYSGGDPEEHVSQKGRHKGLAYSSKPDYYEPRCKLCHNRYDAASRPLATHCKRGHEFTPENVVMRQGKRLCVACNQMRNAKFQATRGPRLDRIKQ